MVQKLIFKIQNNKPFNATLLRNPQFAAIVRKTLLRAMHLTLHHGVLSAVFALAKNCLKLSMVFLVTFFAKCFSIQ